MSRSLKQSFPHTESSASDNSKNFPKMGENSRAYAQTAPISPTSTYNVTPRTVYSKPKGSSRTRPLSSRPRTSAGIRSDEPKSPPIISALENHPLSARASRSRLIRQQRSRARHDTHEGDRPPTSSERSPSSADDEQRVKLKLAARDALKSLESMLGKVR